MPPPPPPPPPRTAHPGLFLGPSSAYAPGPGTHTHAQQIHASLAGHVLSTPSPQSSRPTLSVSRSPASPARIASRLVAARNALPSVGAVVLARVTRLQTRQVTVAVLVVGET
ncbi:exosome 3'-_5 exonuclease subunit ski4 (Csl4), partial [Xylographa trunciseda]|nr:exosome 3'->5 exonuclease subunit ski4 (Csl4) [Xylographa trunciseda]